PVRFDLDHRVGDFHLRLAHEGTAAHLGVLGPSGAGKSALLRSIAGLYGPAPGPVWFGEEEVTARPVERRAVGYVAQGFALYPHLSVWHHALFARGATPELARHWIDRLGLAGLEGRRPAELSGGQRQRVGLAQVLCASPEVLLLDEPFSALDVPVRLELRRELRALQRETGLATVLVTHDPAEAAFLADELLVVSEGRLLQRGPSRELFARPASERVARLLGVENLLEGVVVGSGAIEVAGGRLAVPAHGLAVGTAVNWSVRPERVALVVAPAGAPPDALVGEVVDVVDTGLYVDVVVALGDGVEVRARAPEATAALGERRALVVEPGAVALWPVAEAAAPV
ncbi:MAG TPA: ABC transporter ATP-binding protein, partial [Acidimicrobiales bacterium]|nr:ABC transporter ATP-binding protein [Acidimicrobiales bacterium]